MGQLWMIGMAAFLTTASLALTQEAPLKTPAITSAWSVLTPATVYTKDNAPATPKLESLPLKDSVTQYGITWTFDKPARVGQFVNTDYYVVGPVTVKAIDPKPLYGKDVPTDELDPNEVKLREIDRLRHSFMVDPPAKMEVAYDSGTKEFYRPALVWHLPAALKPGDSMVSTISLSQSQGVKSEWKTHVYHRGVDDDDCSPTLVAAVLTCPR